MSVVQFLYKLNLPYPRAVLCVVNPFLFWVLAIRRYRATEKLGEKRGQPRTSVRNINKIRFTLNPA